MTKNVLHQNCPGWMQVAEKISRPNRATRRYELIRSEPRCDGPDDLYDGIASRLLFHHALADREQG